MTLIDLPLLAKSYAALYLPLIKYG